MFLCISLNISKSMEESQETHNCTAGQEIPCLLWSLDIHYCVHKSHLLNAILNQVKLAHILIPALDKIHFNVILPSIYMFSLQVS
jgi:hypothetical protein